MRSTHKTATFRRAFTLAGVDGEQPPGTYVVVTDEEEIAGVLFTAWRRVETSMRLPAVDVDTGQIQVVQINPNDLAEALAKDDPDPV
jgi:hypothetical protein